MLGQVGREDPGVSDRNFNLMPTAAQRCDPRRVDGKDGALLCQKQDPGKLGREFCLNALPRWILSPEERPPATDLDRAQVRMVKRGPVLEVPATEGLFVITVPVVFGDLAVPIHVGDPLGRGR